ncbi:MAG: ABC transporter ATP-binding protein [Candidatus Binatia bacterium]
MSTDNILTVEHLSKEFKSGDDQVHVLSDVSFAIARGSSCAVVGPSGSGKTTLIAICAGLERPSKGGVEFDGVALHQASEEQLARIRNQSVGFIFQNFQLLPSLTALENVMLPLELRGDSDADGPAREILGKVGLGERLGHYPRLLSGGEQQRVAVARAFATEPKLLFADEPTGNLDSATGAQVIELLFRMNRDHGTTLVLVTHDEALAARCDRRIAISAGVVAA